MQYLGLRAVGAIRFAAYRSRAARTELAAAGHPDRQRLPQPARAPLLFYVLILLAMVTQTLDLHLRAELAVRGLAFRARLSI